LKAKGMDIGEGNVRWASDQNPEPRIEGGGRSGVDSKLSKNKTKSSY